MRHLRPLALALSIVVSLASTSRADTYLPDPKLLAAAQKEGEVVFYTTQIVDQILRPMIKVFQTVAPGVQVKYVRSDGLGLVVRMTNEARAGRVQSDMWCMVDGVQSLLRADMAGEFEVASAQGLPAGLVDPKKRWIALNTGVRSAAYNTNLIPKEQAPRNYQDLLNPRFKGRIV